MSACPSGLLRRLPVARRPPAPAWAARAVLLLMLLPAAPAPGAAWKEGSPHPKAPHVVAAAEKNQWRASPGYAWVNPEDPDSLAVRWDPGREHPDTPHLLAAAREGEWEPDTGYVWVGSGTARRLAWAADAAHPKAPHVRAAADEGEWMPEPGYAWVAPESESLAVVWAAGGAHPVHARVIADDREGHWIPEPGYAWKSGPPASYDVLWKPGLPHPGLPHLVSAPRRGYWAPMAGYQWDHDAEDDYSVVEVAKDADPAPPRRWPPAFSERFIDWDITYEDNVVTGLYGLYGEALGHIATLTVTNRNSEPVTFHVSSELVGFSSPDSGTLKLGPGEWGSVAMTPALDADAVDRLRNRKPAMLRLHLDVRQGDRSLVLSDDTRRLTLHARRDFPWSLCEKHGRSAYDYLAAWVTPHDPAVERLIREAAAHQRSESISSGYEGANDPKWGIYNRLEALWKAMQDHEIVYVSTPLSFAPGFVQRIRLPAEVIEEKSGNCIELSLLLASAAEALELDPILMLLPGHCFVGVALDDQAERYYFIEATMVRGSSFEAARLRGREEFVEHKARFNDGKDEKYLSISVKKAREKGIFPVSWR